MATSWKKRLWKAVFAALAITAPVLFCAGAAMSQDSAPSKLYHTPKQKREAGKKTLIGKAIEFNGLLESELLIKSSRDAMDDTHSESDIIAKTVQLGWKVTMNEDFSGKLTLLWEEDKTEPISIDEGYIKYDGDRFDVSVGKLYPPFGTFESRFITDPLTLELGEIRESALMVHSNLTHQFEAAVTIANGTVDKISREEKRLDDYLIRVDAHTPFFGIGKIDFGVQRYSDIADTDAQIIVDPLTGAPKTGAVLNKIVPGFGAYYTLTSGAWVFNGEFVGAQNRFEPADLDRNADGVGDKPRSWNFELARNVSKDTELAVKYEGSREFFGFPRTRYGIDVSWGLGDGVTFSTEFMHSIYKPDFSNLKRSNELNSLLSIEF